MEIVSRKALSLHTWSWRMQVEVFGISLKPVSSKHYKRVSESAADGPRQRLGSMWGNDDDDDDDAADNDSLIPSAAWT